MLSSISTVTAGIYNAQVMTVAMRAAAVAAAVWEGLADLLQRLLPPNHSVSNATKREGETKRERAL